MLKNEVIKTIKCSFMHGLEKIEVKEYIKNIEERLANLDEEYEKLAPNIKNDFESVIKKIEESLNIFFKALGHYNIFALINLNILFKDVFAKHFFVIIYSKILKGQIGGQVNINEDSFAKLAQVVNSLGQSFANLAKPFINSTNVYYGINFCEFIAKLNKDSISTKFAKFINGLDENGCNIFAKFIDSRCSEGDKSKKYISGKEVLAEAINILNKNEIAKLAILIDNIKYEGFFGENLILFVHFLCGKNGNSNGWRMFFEALNKDGLVCLADHFSYKNRWSFYRLKNLVNDVKSHFGPASLANQFNNIITISQKGKDLVSSAENISNSAVKDEEDSNNFLENEELNIINDENLIRN